MSEIAQTESTEIAAGKQKTVAAPLTENSIDVRVSPNSYFIALFLATFFTGLLIYLEFDYAAAALFVLTWTLIPFLVWSDRISFDGKKLTRTGFMPRFWAWANDSRYNLKLDEIEQVETQALRALKRGGSVFYRYRTSVRGKDLLFVIASGSDEYRRMVLGLLPRLSENLLDNRSIELRDYLSEPKETLMKAAFEKIPSTEVLENSLSEFEHPSMRKKRRKPADGSPPGSAETEKIEYLRRLANELRLSGHLLQALEVFRRALFLNPRSGWLLFEFARCLHSFAGAEKNKRLERKAFAAMRLAEKRAERDEELLARLGETYFQYGDWRRARKVFQKALESAEESFRSVRGMAEIALREGKIAHVIHHFATAQRLAETPALRRWTRSETEYFTRLNSDEEYMELEVSRVNLLENLERGKRTSLKIAVLGLPWIVIGMLLEENLLVNLGWAVSCVALLIWVGMIMSRNILSTRVPIDQD